MQNVFIGLSGGVDSAVSAALLKDAGYGVTGAFIKIWHPAFIECTWREDRLDAMRVCAALSIPYREIDLSAEYWNEVVESMLADYARGVTPNPDILCNQKIKFGHFKRWAMSEGADLVATGHYARSERIGDRAVLKRGADTSKDQSYFLYRLAESDLRQVLFPVGHLRKQEVRELAEKFSLPVSKKPDSQGLCFVGDVSMRDFLKRFIAVQPGAVLDGSGKVVGTHDGAALYTLGQRHGFIVAGASDAVAHFIVVIDIAANTLTVSPDRSAFLRREARLQDAHWIGGAPSARETLTVQSRYRDVPASASMAFDDSGVRCVFDEPHAAAPGQSLVAYDGDACLGGGIIAA